VGRCLSQKIRIQFHGKELFGNLFGFFLFYAEFQRKSLSDEVDSERKLELVNIL
jgi:hypothetical protein